MITSFNRLLFVAFFPFLTQVAQSQNVRFATQELPAVGAEVVIVAKEQSSKSFKLKLNSLTESHRVRERDFTIVSAEGQQVIAQITLPPKGNDFVVLLMPSAEEPQKEETDSTEGEQRIAYHGVSIVDSKKNFKPGQFYLYNNTTKTVICSLDDEKSEITAQSSQILKPKAKRDQVSFKVEISSKNEDESLAPISSSRWPVSPEMRHFIFFFADPKNGRITFRSVDESME